MAKTKKRRLEIKRWQWVAALLIVIDAICSALSYFIALWLRYDCAYSKIPTNELYAWLRFAPIYAAFTVLVCLLLRLYRSIWRFASLSELKRAIFASLILGVAHGLGITFIFCPMPWLYYFLGILLQFLLLTFARFFYRFLSVEKTKLRKKDDAHKSRVMIIGAGSAGQMVIRDLKNNKASLDDPVCIIDDNKNTWGRTVEGIKVLGGRDDILVNAKKHRIDKIYLAIPSATAEARRDILSICQESGCELKNLPGIRDILDDKVTVTAGCLQKVTIEDLLGREPIKVDGDETFLFLKDKVVLVTGGGGSIGSELCRQIAVHSPKKLIVFDVYENNAHAIALEIKDKFPSLDMVPIIGSVRDSSRLDEVFRLYRPDVVFHAAAHKHVPLMEISPCEAIKNNAIGTYKTAYAALASGCKRFVLISTDKAVNPTNIMGASKRICEMIIQSFAFKVKEGKVNELLPITLHNEACAGREIPKIGGDQKTEFVAVRFGNVLGSNGSVVPRFKQQIEAGGPVTVTDPEIIRYFMTIPEASSLVLEAGAYAKGGEIFVLDMGSPVKIDTLARNMIKLAGFRPDVDIKIAYTGLRPGEKLYEEKLMDEEGLQSTKNKLIHIARPISFDVDAFLGQLPLLLESAYDEKEDEIRKIVADIVPTYHPAGVHGSHLKGEAYERQVDQMEKKEAFQDHPAGAVSNPRA